MVVTFSYILTAVTFSIYKLDARLAEIAKRLHEEKLMDFAKVEEPDLLDSNLKSTCRSHVIAGGLDQTNVIDDEIKEAIDIEDSDKVTDLKEFAKTSQSVKNDPDRFTCVLGKYANKQPSQKRLYLLSLPHYIEEKQKARAIAIQQSLKKGPSSDSLKNLNLSEAKKDQNQIFSPQQIH